MEKTSRNIGLKLQKDLLDEAFRFVSQESLCAFLRVAFIEKLNRDFGCDIDPQQYAGGRGSRFDIPNRITEAEKRSRKGMRPRGRPRKETPARSSRTSAA